MDVELGKIVGVWGVKGWIKLHSYTRNRVDINQYDTWYLQAPRRKKLSSTEVNSTELEKVTVISCREQGPGVVAQLEGITDRDQAMTLNGYRIFVSKTDLPVLPEGEYYWQQLIGLAVSNDCAPIGQISSILETGANDVLVCKSVDQTKGDVLIPYNDQVIKDVDLQQGTMLVDWDPSFLED